MSSGPHKSLGTYSRHIAASRGDGGGPKPRRQDPNPLAHLAACVRTLCLGFPICSSEKFSGGS